MVLLAAGAAPAFGLSAAGSSSLSGAVEVITDGLGSCALLSGGGVDCWGFGQFGQLGNGSFYTTGADGSALPVKVKGVRGMGNLSGVSALVSDADASNGSGFCALLSSGGVDCWGYGGSGQLGDGIFYGSSANYGSAVPVAVKAVSGGGTLTGVSSLVEDGTGYCALISSGGVDCWGYGSNGQLGNGTFYGSGNYGSAVPVTVKGVGGKGVLTGVHRLFSDGDFDYPSYCAVLSGGGVDCWGFGNSGELGNGNFYNNTGADGSAVPVQVKGVGGAGTLVGVSSLAADYRGYCAVLSSGGVDCWGYGISGELGNGRVYTTRNDGSAVPVAVQNLGGAGLLSDVSAVISDSSFEGSGGGTFCALLTSGAVDCWGSGGRGELGNGTFYTTGFDGSAVPVAVHSVSGAGKLTGVTNLTGDNGGFCALLTTGRVDCWGYGALGQIGNGTFYDSSNNYGSAVPVAVLGLGGGAALTGVSSLDVYRTADASGANFCALIASGRIDCWGDGTYGQLGDGTFYATPTGSAIPVSVR